MAAGVDKLRQQEGLQCAFTRRTASPPEAHRASEHPLAVCRRQLDEAEAAQRAALETAQAAEQGTQLLYSQGGVPLVKCAFCVAGEPRGVSLVDRGVTLRSMCCAGTARAGTATRACCASRRSET